jgi:uncharacterized repeat protein (TIGR01451 family)
VAGVLSVGALLGAAPAGAAPGTPEPPVTVFTEDFENVPAANTALALDAYTGPGPLAETYTAAPAWLPPGATCNGIILSFNMTTTAGDGCTFYAAIEGLANTLGVLNGSAAPHDNHATSAYTSNNPGVDAIEFETVTPIPLPAGTSRFITFSVNAAAINCFASAPLYKFYLLDPAVPASETPTFTSPINPCVLPGGVGSFPSNGSVLFSGGSLGIRLRNGNGSGGGNDAAFDDIKVLDATPQLDKEFTSPVAPNGSSRLTLTITNTTDLAGKPGWSFTDTLPTGLTVAPAPNLASTCANDTVTAPAGGTSIDVTGDLLAGDASCNVQLDVVASAPGTYTNGPGNIDPKAGVNLPPPATVVFQGPPTVTITQPPPKVPTGATTPLELDCTADAGLASCTATVTLPDGTTVPISDGDNVPTTVPGVYTITGTAVDVHGNTVTTTRTYEVFPPPTVTIPGPPAGTLLPLNSTTPGNFTCGAGAPPLTCTARVTLPDGSTVPLLDGGPLPAQAPGVYTITATVVDAFGRTVTTTRTYEVLPAPTADLVVTKRANHTAVDADEPIRWTVTVTNRGPGPATDVVALDDPSIPVEFSVASSTAGTCSGAAPVRCALGTITAGSTVTITLIGRAQVAGSLVNRATATAKQPDPRPANNVAKTTTAVRGTLRVTKRADRSIVLAGARIGYVIRVANPTRVAVENARICDRLPTGLAFVSSSPRAVRSGGRYCWALGTVAAHRSKSVTLTTRTLRGASGRVRNVATLTARGVVARAAASPAIRVLSAANPGGGVTG